MELANKYYMQGADEIILMDNVASLYGRNNLYHILNEVCKDVFIPITIGGGIRHLKDIEKALKAGADKISLNTAAIQNPDLISEAASKYGSQCIIGSIEAKRKHDHWEAYTNNGRDETGKNVFDWAKELEDLGVGEIMINSIDNDGTKQGFNIELIRKINQLVSVPVIAASGAGTINHINELCLDVDISAISIASILHYNISSIGKIKESLNNANLNIRL